MRAAGRHTAPPVILKRVRRPPPDPDSTLQARQPPSAMRPAHLADPAIAARHTTSPPRRPGNRRPPCDQPTLQTRQSPPTRHTALPPYRPNRCRTAQAVLTRSRRLFHGPAAPPQPKGAEGTAGRGRSRQGSRREGVQSEEPAAASGRAAGGRVRSRKAGE